jgi:hypothetical protein
MDTFTSSETSPRPPPVAAVALLLLGAEFVIAVGRSVLMRDWSRPVPSVVSVVVLFAVCGLWLHGLWRRKTWLWWVTVILAGTGCVMSPWANPSRMGSTQATLYWCQVVLAAPATLLLLMPASQKWYRKHAAT